MNVLSVDGAGLRAPVLRDELDVVQAQPQDCAHAQLFTHRHQGGVIVDGFLDAAGGEFRPVAVDGELSGFQLALDVDLIDGPAHCRRSPGDFFAAIGTECRALHDLVSALDTVHINISPLCWLSLL